MAVEAYSIGISLILDQSKVIGPLAEVMKAMERVQKGAQTTQTSLNDMTASLRGAGQVAASLAASMERVAAAAGKAARAGAGVGHGLPVAAPERVALPGRAPALALPPPGAALPQATRGDGFVLGPSRGPSRALVPAGHLYTHDQVRSPDRGPLAAYHAAGGAARRTRMGPGGAAQADASFFEDGDRGGPLPLFPKDPRAPGKSASAADVVATGVGGYYAGKAVVDGVEAALRPSFDVVQNQKRLQGAGLSEAEAASVIATAREQQRLVRGTNVGGNTEVFRTLLSLTQDADEAKKLLPAFLPTGVALESFNPQAGDYVHQLDAVMRSAEFKGAVSKVNPDGSTTVDAAGAKRMADMLLGMTVVSNGGFNPKTGLQFLRSGGTAAANMDLSELPFLLPVLQALGPARAGTGLQGFEQQFSSGKMSNAAVNMLQQMGILSTNPALYRKLGMGQFMLKPGALNETAFEKAMFQPREFMQDNLLPQVQAYNRKNYGKTYDAADPDHRRAMDAATLQQMASRIPGGTFMTEMLRNLALMIRDGTAYQRVSKQDITGTLNDSPLVSMKAFGGALDSLVGTLGGEPFKGAIGALNTLTSGINALNAAAASHPQAAKDAGGLAGDLALGGGGALAGVLAGNALSKLGAEAAGTAIAAASKAAFTRVVLPFLVDKAVSGVVDAFTGEDWAKVLDRKIPALGRIDKWFHDHTGGWIGQDNTAAPTAQHSSYMMPQGGGVPMQRASYAAPTRDTRPIIIHASFPIDGDVIHRTVVTRLDRDARSAVQYGTTGHDGSETPMLAGGSMFI